MTNNRPRSFALVEQAVQGQTRKPDEWVVGMTKFGGYALGGDTPVPAYWCLQLPNERDEPDMIRNLRRGLKVAQERGADWVAIMEDDDWYRDTYLDDLVKCLEPGVDLIGLAPAHYYHLPSRRWQCANNNAHASLGMTMFSAKLIPRVLALCDKGSPFLDIPLWQGTYTHAKRLIPSTGSDGKLMHIGFKGCPGEPGIGVGHRKPLKHHDPEGKWLRHHMGREAEAWLSLVEAALPTKPSSYVDGA